MAEFFSYKGRPLVRSGNIIYYGDMHDPYVVMLEIKSTEDVKDIKVAKSVSLSMMSTDLTLPPEKLVPKKASREGLYQALDLAATWLDRGNK